MTVKVDLLRVAEIIREVAGTEVLPRFRHLTAADIQQKTSSHDLVTTADKMSEKALRSRLVDYMPGSLVVGEEETYVNPDAYERLKSDKYVWVIDPVDGTNNFSKGFDDFGIIVALVKNCQTVCGWVYAPVRDEMVVAELGSGAFFGNARLHVVDTDNVSDALAVTGGTYPVLKEKLKDTYWTHSAAIAYQHLAMGKASYGVFSTKPIKPWDHAAGVLLHGEAGGYSALSDGRQYTPYPVEGTLFLAPSKERWEEVREFVG